MSLGLMSAPSKALLEQKNISMERIEGILGADYLKEAKTFLLLSREVPPLFIHIIREQESAPPTLPGEMVREKFPRYRKGMIK